MIQRIQTLLLILAVGLNIGFVFTPLQAHAFADPTEWISSGLVASLLLSTLVSIYSIFLFKKRMNQIRWIFRGMIFQIIAIGFAAAVMFTLGGIGNYLWDEGLSLALIVLALIAQYLAVHYIKKDEKLVRSMDRIR